MKSLIVRATWYGLGVVALIFAIEGQAHAGALQTVPEINGSTLSAGFGLLAAGVMIVRSRMKAK